MDTTTRDAATFEFYKYTIYVRHFESTYTISTFLQSPGMMETAKRYFLSGAAASHVERSGWAAADQTDYSRYLTVDEIVKACENMKVECCKFGDIHSHVYSPE